MKHLFTVSLFISIILFSSACTNQATTNGDKSTEVDSLQINAMNVVVPTSSELLGEPRELVLMDEQHFAVYDHAYQKMMVFDTSGTKQYEFGSTGRGPGEWDPMSGATDLNFRNNQFLTNNREEFKLDLYDREGAHIRSIPYKYYPRYSDKVWMEDEQLLAATHGKDSTLAVVTNLNNNEEIVLSIGTSATDYLERMDLDQERESYTNGEVPESAKNEALVAKAPDGFILFINAVGEIQRYSNEGELLFKKLIPNYVKQPIFDHAIQRNKELDSPGVVYPLEYAKDIRVENGLLYIFMPKKGLDGNVPDAQILIYDLDGMLQKQYVFTDQENSHFLYDMIIDEQSNIYLIDVMNAQILSFKANIDLNS